MQITGSIALVTGANRGIGKAFVAALIELGAAKVYATARRLDSLAEVVAIAPDRIIPLALDVTDREQVATIAAQATDTTLLINNAGLLGAPKGLFAATSWDTAQAEMQTNCFGTLAMMQAFAPILKTSGGGAIVNLLSIVSVGNVPMFGSYSASKAAVYSMTQGARAELAAQGTLVVGVFPGPVDTPMSDTLPLDKAAPLDVAKVVLQGVADGVEDIYPDPFSQGFFTDVKVPLKAIEQQFAPMVPQ